VKKTIGVIGCNGNLGYELISHGCIPMECDIQNKKSISQSLRKVHPDVIINTAAITDVDECEDELSQLAYQVNCAAIANVRDEFMDNIIHISTAYVFDGKKKTPYTEQDEPNPISVYGRSKLGGEQRLLEYDVRGDCVVRTMSLYGGHKADFVTKVLKQIKDGKEITIPNNLFGNPTYILHLAEALVALALLDVRPKIVNIVGKEVMSRYDLAIMAINMFGWGDRIDLLHPTNKVGGIAPRPKNAGLTTKVAIKLGIPIYSVLDGLQDMYVQRAFMYGKE